MKLSYKTALILISVTIVSISGWKLYTQAYFRNGSKLSQMKCHYMMYACRECTPQWRIDSDFAIKNGLASLVGKDFYVFYKDEKIEDHYLPDSCVICCDFYFTGVMKKTLSGKMKFIAERFNAELDTNCCKQ